MTRNTARICAVAEYEDAITCLGYGFCAGKLFTDHHKALGLIMAVRVTMG
jgi:hypothetical protein